MNGVTLPVGPFLAAIRLGGAGWWGVALAMALGGLAFWLYRRQLADAPPLRRALLPTLRGLAVTAVALMVGQPSLFHSRTIERPGQVIVLADVSASMTVPDLQAQPSHKLLTARALGLADTTGANFALHDLAARLAELRAQALTSETGVDPRELLGGAARLADAMAQLDPALVAAGEVRGTATMERWNNIPGRRLSDLQRDDPLAREPDLAEQITSLRLPRNDGENFARRIRGVLYPPQTGAYQFHLAADAAAAMGLSENEHAVNIRSILRLDARTAPDDFSRVSPPVSLEAGKAYAFEIVHKEGEHDDHLTVAWSIDGGAPMVIQGSPLSAPPSVLDPARRRDELARAFREQIAVPAGALAQLPTAGREAAVGAVLESLAEWEVQLRQLFDAYVASRFEAGDAPVVAAAVAYDKLTRHERVRRLLDADGGTASPRVLALEKSGEVVRRDVGAHTASDTTYSALTDLAAALAAVDPSDERRHAVVLLSDGRHNVGTSAPAEAAASLGRRGVPVFPLLVGSGLPPRDLALLEVVGPQAVHREDLVTGRIVLLDTMPPGRPFMVAIRDGETVLWEQELETAGRGRREVEYSFGVEEAVAARLGRAAAQVEDGARVNELLLPLQVDVGALEGEMQAANNLGDLPVRVTLGTGRVLVLDGRARWDARYLVSLLGRDRRWQVDAVLGPDGTEKSLPRGEGGFPESPADLFEYDVIVLGEVPASWWSEEELRWIAAFVDERGGGLILIDGTRGQLLDYADTPIGKLLPVVREGAPPMRVRRLVLTPAGEARDALRLEPDAARNAELWPSLPPPRWTVPVTLLPGAELLAEAETVDGAAVPAIVTRPVGRGRVWYQAFDETWRWRKDAENRWQARYWSGVANHIMEPPFAVEDRFVALGVEKAAVEPDEKVSVRVRLRDEEGNGITGEAAEQLAASIVLTKDGAPKAQAKLEPDASGGGLFRAEVQAPTDAGAYEVGVASDRYSATDLTARAGLLVRRPAAGGEMARLDADEALMRQLAQSSGGRFLHEHEAAQLADIIGDLSRRQTLTSEYNLWTSWPLFAAVIGLLGIEWAVRRRTGML